MGDYTTAQQKVAEVVAARSVLGTGAVAISPNIHGDWLSQRAEDFEHFTGISGATGVFTRSSNGVKTNRDAWCYAFGLENLLSNVQRLTATYEADRRSGGEPTREPTRIAWSGGLELRLRRGETLVTDAACVRLGKYRPFTKQRLYFSDALNERRYRLAPLFPTSKHGNFGIELTGPASHFEFCALAADAIPDLHLLDTGQFFPRWTWEPVAEEATLDLGSTDGDVVDGYRRTDNITDAALAKWQAAYGPNWTKDDVFFYVYGLLHSPDYRERYAADLKKMLPRIPLVATPADARAFADAGRKLSELHIGYESVAPYALVGLDVQPIGDPYEFFAVGAKKMRFGDKGKDRTVIQFNDRITVSGIPEEAYRYMLGSRSAIEWIIDRYWIKTDKASGIVNDPNDWSAEVGDPRYILDLLARVVALSVATVRIVERLPALTIHTAARSAPS